MPIRVPETLIRTTLVLVVALGTLVGSGAQADILRTTDPAAASAFMAGASVESFDDLTAHPIASYAAGQTIGASAQWNSRDPLVQPTFNSGGGSPDDVLNNPGQPIAILDPEGAIGADVQTPEHVAGPTVITDPLQPFANGFLEIFFPEDVARIGFWVTHGPVQLLVYDRNGDPVGDGDDAATAAKGEFIGIDRGTADIGRVTLFGFGSDAFTIDDVTWSNQTQLSPPQEARQRLAWVEHLSDGSSPGVDGLDGAGATAISYDGRHVYVLASTESALSVFERDAHTGLLEPVQTLRDSVGGVDGLGFGMALRVTPDDRHVLVTASENTLAVFARDAVDGRLTLLQVLRDGVDGVTGIRQVFDFEITPNGRFVYLPAHVSNAVARFERDPDAGFLTFLGANDAALQTIGGLPDHSCLSPDGRHLYVASFNDDLTVFAVDQTTGDLTFIENEDFERSTNDCTVTADGRFVYTVGEFISGAGTAIEILRRDESTGGLTRTAATEATSFFVAHLELSPSGDHLYARGGDHLGVFEIDETNGGLRPIETLEDEQGGVQGLDRAAYPGTPVAASPDGRHVYTTGDRDDAIATFSASVYRPEGFTHAGDGSGNLVPDDLAAVAIDGDGRHVFVVGESPEVLAAYALDPTSGRLSLLDIERNGDTDPESGLIVSDMFSPVDVVLSPDGLDLYVANNEASTIGWFARNGDGTLAYRGAFPSLLLEEVNDIAISPDGRHLYAASPTANSWLVFERLADGSLVLLPEGPALPGERPASVAVSPDGGYVFVGLDGTSGAQAPLMNVYRRDATSGALTWVDQASVSMLEGVTASDIAVTSDGSSVYVAVRASDVPTFGMIRAYAWDSASEELTFVDVVTNQADGTIDGLASIEDVAISPDGAYLVGTGRQANGFSVFAVDPKSGALVLVQDQLESEALVGTGLYATRGLGFTSDGSRLLAVGGGDEGAISVFVPEPGVGSGLLAGVVALGLVGRRSGVHTNRRA